MRKSAATLTALLAASALALAGCSGNSDAQSEQSADAGGSDSGGTCEAIINEAAQSQSGAVEPDTEASQAALDSVQVDEKDGGAPTAVFEAPLDITSEAVRLVDEGTGDPVAEGQVLTLNYMVCDVATGEKLHSTWGADSSENTPLNSVLSAGNFGQMLDDLLNGIPVGSTVLWGQPGVSAEASITGQATNGYLYVMNVAAAHSVPESASGTEVKPSDDSLPTVKFEDGKPVVSIPDTFTDPTELVVEPLIEGDGPVVEQGQAIAVKYTGWLTDGTQFDSAWDREGADGIFVVNIGTGNVISGWDEGLVGQKVGSRVLMVIPSDKGYGTAGAGTIPADSTLIFVVDILGAF